MGKLQYIRELGNQVAQLHAFFENQETAVANSHQRQRLGYIDTVACNHLTHHSLIKFHKNVFSQTGQDGILEEIFARLKIDTGTFIEFGGWDGIYLSNCRYLALQGWKGIFIEANARKFQELEGNYRDNSNIKAINKFVNFEGQDTVDEIIKSCETETVDFLSIDIDGLDYKILETLNVKPKVILMEGGYVFSPYLNARIPDEIAQQNLSQPLPILLSIANNKGYTAVCFFQDLYLVRNDLAEVFFNYNEYPLDLYRDWYFGISSFGRDYLRNHYRCDCADSIIKLLESQYLGRYEVNPLGYV